LERLSQAAAIFTSADWLQKTQITNPTGQVVKADNGDTVIVVGQL
jgi:hypothetical protein